MLVKRPSRRQATITTIVESLSSERVGQLAFCSSPMSSLKKRRAERNGLAMGCIGRRRWQARRESNPQPTVLETATLPIELRACFWSFLDDTAEAPSEASAHRL